MKKGKAVPAPPPPEAGKSRDPVMEYLQTLDRNFLRHIENERDDADVRTWAVQQCEISLSLILKHLAALEQWLRERAIATDYNQMIFEELRQLNGKFDKGKKPHGKRTTRRI